MMAYSKNKKILFIHQENHIGGGNTYVNGIRSGLQESGVGCELIECSDTIDLVKKLNNSSEKYVLWSIYDRFPLIPYIFSFLKGKKNILIIYGIWKLESRALFRDYNDPDLVRSQKARELKYLIKQFLFILFSSKILHLSNYSKKLYMDQPLFRFAVKKEDAVIFGGADKKIFKKIAFTEKEKLRKDLGIGERDILLLMAGRIEERKNYTDGIRILKKLKNMMPGRNIYLYLILSFGSFNDYSYFDLIFRQIARNGMGNYIRIVSGINNSDIYKYFQVADVYLMLSKELETFGLVTVESLQCGLPVFGYSACATPEIVANNRYRSLYPAGKISDLTKKIAGYLRMNKNEKGNIYTKNSSKLQYFTWKKTSDKILEVL